MAEEASNGSAAEGGDDEGRGYWEDAAAARDAGYCGRMNREDEPCLLPAGWGTPGTSERGDACRFHGGASTGPDDTSHLDGNDYAAGNDGGAPEGNTNALVSGAFVPLDRLPERVPPEVVHDTARWEWYAVLVSRARRPGLREDRRHRLAKRWAWLDVRSRAAAYDAYTDGPDAGRGFTVERERTYETADAGEATVSVHVRNPSLAVDARAGHERLDIAKILGLFDDPGSPAEEAGTRAAPPLALDRHDEEAESQAGDLP